MSSKYPAACGGVLYLPGAYLDFDAKAVCDNLVKNGYSDWFLPNKEQLNKLWLKKSVVGGFVDDNVGYWSSSEDSAGKTWAQNFNGGHQNQIDKKRGARARAVRSF